MSKCRVPVPEALVDRIDNERRGQLSAANDWPPCSAAFRVRVEAAWAWQSARFDGAKDGQGASLTTNVDMGPTQVRDHCPVDETGRQLWARPCGGQWPSAAGRE